MKKSILFLLMVILTLPLGAQKMSDYKRIREQKLAQAAEAEREREEAKAAARAQRLLEEAAAAEARAKMDSAAKHVNNTKEAYRNAALAEGYVDLGLPSGTLWKRQNEEAGLMSLLDAKYSNFLPAKSKYEELIESCTWTWRGNGYMVTGASGDSLFLPALGARDCQGKIIGEGVNGEYWTSTIEGKRVWYLFFNEKMIRLLPGDLCGQRYVRYRQNFQ